MPSAYEQLDARLRVAFATITEGADPVLRPSDHSDFQANGAMAVAKLVGRPPRDVANDVISVLEIDDLAHAELAGPGFINLTLSDAFLGRALSAVADDERLGVPLAPVRTVVVDYSHPNVAKEMHVGHLRSTIIGDSIRRVHEFLGHRVLARNHIGDWGTPFGMLIEHLIDLGEDAAIASLSIGDLDSFYKAARAKFDADESFRERSRLRVVELQSGDAATLRLWRILVDQSVRYFEEVYRKLDVELTSSEIYGESWYNDQLDAVVSDLDAAGLLEESDGALCVFPPGFERRDGEPMGLIVRKSDEGYGYVATDLAAIRDRVDELGADEILYVVGAPQAQHFAMVFATARLAGWLPDRVRVEHVSFGNVLGKDRKMYKARAGESVKLVELLDEAIEKADDGLRQRNPDMDGDERRQLAAIIARAAVKYADLSNERHKDYVFDLDRMLSFEGDTGPYLAYAHARVRSIFRRLDEPWTPGPVTWDFSVPVERELAVYLLQLPEAIDATVTHLAPHKLCTYLFELAQRFTAFYEACPVLTAPADQREQRLVLCELSARTLALGLGLLGIEAPERM